MFSCTRVDQDLSLQRTTNHEPRTTNHEQRTTNNERIGVFSMRFSLTLFASFFCLVGLSWADETPSKVSKVQPIAVVTLDRKGPVTFEKDIEPILANKCATCHSGNVKEGKFDLGSYEALLKGGKHGSAIVACKQACSRS